MLVEKNKKKTALNWIKLLPVQPAATHKTITIMSNKRRGTEPMWNLRLNRFQFCVKYDSFNALFYPIITKAGYSSHFEWNEIVSVSERQQSTHFA